MAGIVFNKLYFPGSDPVVSTMLADATFAVGFITRPQGGLAIGLCLDSGVVALLSYLLTDAPFLAWGWRIAFLLSGVMVFAGMCARYIFGVFSIGYLTSTLKITRTDALIGVMAAAIVMIFTIPYFGRLSDRIGRSRVFFWGALVTWLLAFPGFWLMTHSGGSMLQIWLAVILPFGIFYAAIRAPGARAEPRLRRLTSP